jgi:hypothetical protein
MHLFVFRICCEGCGEACLVRFAAPRVDHPQEAVLLEALRAVTLTERHETGCGSRRLRGTALCKHPCCTKNYKMKVTASFS